MPSKTPSGIRRATLAAALAALVATTVAGPLHAQDGDDTGSVLEVVREARDATGERIDEIQDSIELACEFIAGEACAVNFVAVELPTVADELSAYADFIEGLDVPEDFRDDAVTLVAGLRAEVDLVGVSVAAAQAADEPAGREAFDALQAAAADLAAQLDPEWARVAFVTSLGEARTVDISATGSSRIARSVAGTSRGGARIRAAVTPSRPTTRRREPRPEAAPG
jgi:hypothetical protein